jgi:hypothetical protein
MERSILQRDFRLDIGDSFALRAEVGGHSCISTAAATLFSSPSSAGDTKHLWIIVTEIDATIREGCSAPQSQKPTSSSKTPRRAKER